MDELTKFFNTLAIIPFHIFSSTGVLFYYRYLLTQDNVNLSIVRASRFHVQGATTRYSISCDVVDNTYTSRTTTFPVWELHKVHYHPSPTRKISLRENENFLLDASPISRVIEDIEANGYMYNYTLSFLLICTIDELLFFFLPKFPVWKSYYKYHILNISFG